MPEDGWEDREVEQVLAQLSAMDSNNFPANCGVGEREARLFSRQGSRYFDQDESKKKYFGAFKTILIFKILSPA